MQCSDTRVCRRARGSAPCGEGERGRRRAVLVSGVLGERQVQRVEDAAAARKGGRKALGREISRR